MNEIFDLLYLVYENKLETQREFADALFVSLGKVNSLVKEAEDLGYLLINKTYELSDKGLRLLEDHKVDNAIILAAGFGSRFVPMTYDTPKGLLEVFDEVMIERQIKQLHEVGIFDITLVVGYLKEKFEYLRDKYGVKLIYNPDFSEKNNISSVYYAKDEFKNTYLLTSDIYMPDNLYRKYEYYPFYAIEYHKEKTEEWGVTINKSNEILSVNPFGGEACWAINGPVFFTKKFSKQLIAEVEAVYEEDYAKDWYWENVWTNKISELKLFGRKFQERSILEFESLEELRDFDPSYLSHSRSDILEIIKETFNCELKDIVHIEILKEGMTNESFLFTVFGQAYVFRNPGKGTEALIKRQEEAHVYEIIKDLKISDDVVYLDPQNGYKITHFIDGFIEFDHDNEDQRQEAFDLIRDFHNSGLEVNHDFDIEERIYFYYDLIKNKNAILFNDFDEVFQMIKEVLKYLKSLDRPKVLAHVDFVSANLFFHEKGLNLLDWEYAGMADPLIDLAMYILYDNHPEDVVHEILELYLERKPSHEELMVLYAYIALGGFLWAMWTLYKQSEGEHFGTYAMDQYQYARMYARKVLNEK